MGVPGLRVICNVRPVRCMCAPTRTTVPAFKTGQVHDVVSPAGGSTGLRPQIDSREFTNPTAPGPNRCPRSASEAARLHSDPVTPAAHGTSTSLITGSRSDNGCQDYRQFIGALHVAYTGSQLQYAESYVAANPRTKFVSMMIGANDLFHLANSCQNRPACVLSGLPTLLGTLQTNLTTIYSGLRAGGFHGDFVAVTYYSTNYADPLVTGAIELVDGVLVGVTHVLGGKISDGFDAFKATAAPYGGDSCAAGLLIHRSTTTCDVHPTQLGASLLASAVYAAEGA